MLAISIPDGTVVGNGGVPGALLQVQRLVNGAVLIEHEMDAQIARVLENLEAGARGAGLVKVQDELIHIGLQGGKVPAAAAHPLNLLQASACGRATS